MSPASVTQVDARRQLKVQSEAVLALYDAASMGLTEAVHSLLEAGVKLNTLSERDGSTALYAAAGNGRRTVVEALLQAGADPLARDWVRRTPADRAHSARHAVVLPILSRFAGLVVPAGSVDRSVGGGGRPERAGAASSFRTQSVHHTHDTIWQTEPQPRIEYLEDEEETAPA